MGRGKKRALRRIRRAEFEAIEMFDRLYGGTRRPEMKQRPKIEKESKQ